MTTRWKPKYDCKKNARHHEKIPNAKGRLVFHSECNICKGLVPETTATVDHIEPIINPATGVNIIPAGKYKGEVDWNPVIYEALHEIDGLQTLCAPCHDKKTKEEKAIDTARRRKERASRL